VIISPNIQAVLLQPQISPINAAQATISSSILTYPSAVLTPDDRIVIGFACYRKSRFTEYISYSSLYPVENTIVNTAAITFSMASLYSFPSEAFQNDDYIFSVFANNFALTKQVVIMAPSGIKFNNADCMQAEGSDIEIAKCRIDVSKRYIWMSVYNKASYTG
jgi:hypothetical protein